MFHRSLTMRERTLSCANSNKKGNKQMATILPIKKTESIFDELEHMQDRIMHRAYDLFERRGGMFGGDLDDWLTAEHELVWKPPVEMTEKAKEFSLRIAMPGV